VRLKLERTMKLKWQEVLKISTASWRMRLLKNNYLVIKWSMICILLSSLICLRSKELLNPKKQKEKKTIKVSWRQSPLNLAKSTKMSMLKRSKENNLKQLSSTCSRMLWIVSKLNLMERKRQGNIQQTYFIIFCK